MTKEIHADVYPAGEWHCDLRYLRSDRVQRVLAPRRYARMRSPAGSNKGSRMIVAGRRSPKISTSKLPTAVFSANARGT